MWRQMVEREVAKAGTRVVDLDLASGSIMYSRRIRQHRPVSTISSDDEIVRADLVSRFVNEMGYEPEYIELDRPVVVTDPDGSTRTETVDVVVNQTDGSPFFFAAVKSPDTFEDDDGTAARLIRTAEAELASTGKVVQHLFYYTVVVNSGELSGESVMINFEHFLKGVRIMEQDELQAGSPKIRFRPNPLARPKRHRRLVRLRYQGTSYFLLLH